MNQAKTSGSAKVQGGLVAVRLRRKMMVNGIRRSAGEVINIDPHAAGVFVLSGAAGTVDGKELGPVKAHGATVRTMI
jgi:hypothetical protein